jgi:predicted DNA binding protein
LGAWRSVRYDTVVSLTDAAFSHDSPLNYLTVKQRKVLITVYRLGYYDVPRRINSEQLAERLGIGDSTLVKHLRKTEKRVLDQMLADTAPRV